MKYSESHEWIDVQGDVGVVGITAHASRELGEVVYIELPTVGKQVKMGEEVAILESTKAAADIYSPASGEIVVVNNNLKESLEILNQLPESEGWLYKIKLEKPSELDHLLNKEEYLNLVS